MFLSDLRFFCSCCRTSCVSAQPCTPKVLPNTETFLHSRVFFVTCVVPALCQIMYSLSVCSDGTTSAAPRSFRQNRPPARTLSLTEQPNLFPVSHPDNTLENGLLFSFGTHYLSRFMIKKYRTTCTSSRLWKSLGPFQVHHKTRHTLTDNLLRTLTMYLSLSLSLSLSLPLSQLLLIVGTVITLSIRNPFPQHPCTFSYTSREIPSIMEIIFPAGLSFK